jgi:hypothetical protein
VSRGQRGGSPTVVNLSPLDRLFSQTHAKSAARHILLDLPILGEEYKL